MVNNRRESLTFYCTWCKRVRSGKAWVSERRRVRTGPVANSICQGCRSFYLTGFDLEGFMDWYRKEIR